MFFISFLLAFFIFLIAISMVNLFLSFAIKLVTNNTIEEYKFVIPSVLYLIITGVTFLLIYLVTINILDLSIRDSIMAIIFKTVDISSKFSVIISLDSIILIISIIIQSLCLMTVNIDYTVTLGKIRMMFKDLFKKFKKNKKEAKNTDENNGQDLEKLDEIENENINETITDENIVKEDISNLAAVVSENELAENKERLKLSFGNSIICTIFIFSFLFFMFMALFFVGSIISSKIL